MDREEFLKKIQDSDFNIDDTGDYIKKLRMSIGMSRKEFCEYTGIPYRTLQDWELGNREMPPYVLRIMTYAILFDVLPKLDESNKNDNH